MGVEDGELTEERLWFRDQWKGLVEEAKVIAVALQIEEVWKTLAPGVHPGERWNPQHIKRKALTEAIGQVAELREGKQKGVHQKKRKALEAWMTRR